MKYKSTFYNKSTSFKNQLHQFLTSGLAIIITFVFIASNFDNSRKRYSRTGRIFKRAYNGVKEMSEQEIILSVGVSLLVGLIVLFIVDQINGKKKLIVGFDINERKKELSFAIKKMSTNNIIVKTFNSDKIAFKIKKKRDGMSNIDYDSLIFSSNLKTIGTLHLSHDMWENINKEEFNDAIKKIKQLTT